MEKIKRNFIKVKGYILTRRFLTSSIIVILLLLPSGIILTKYINNKEKVIEKEVVANNTDDSKNVAKGTINTDVISDNISRHTLSDGFSDLSNNSSVSSSTTNNSSSGSMSTNIIDKSSISGVNIEILEGHEFNPRKDLKLKATDNNGRDISDNIIIEKNNVNTTVPGIYNVKVHIKLSNGQSKEKEFTVTVKETHLDVLVKSFKATKMNVKKNEKIGFELDLNVSKKHVTPIAVMVNGQEYTLYKGNENIIEKLMNIRNYKLFIDAKNASGIYQYNLEYVKMSNGSWINLGENTVNVEVLKDEATIKNFSYEELSIEKKIGLKFDLEDLDNTASNLRLEVYKDDKLLESKKLNKISSYTMNIDTKSNGVYNLKILADIDLNQNSTKNSTLFNKEIFTTFIKVSNINQTSLTGKDAEIIQGEKFDPIKDLDLKATDFDGEDITNQILIENNDIDANIVGQYDIVAYIINKNGEKYSSTFKLTINPSAIKEDTDGNISDSDIFMEQNLEENLFSRLIKFKKEDESKLRISSNTIDGSSTETLRQNIVINGSVKKSDGSAPEGRIEVELPTAMAFSVDQDGNFLSGYYTITNKSSVGISVSVATFADSNPNGGITIKSKDKSLDGLDRSNLHLELVGKQNSIDLGKSITSPMKLLDLNPLDVDTIKLIGEAGNRSNEAVDEKGISDNFSLVFNIKKKN